jgi:hypothetical protein
MARVLDANVLFAGSEPRFSPLGEIDKVEMARALNWYSNNKGTKEALKWATEYFKKKLKITIVESALKDMPSTFGFVCRISSNGGVLSTKDQAWLDAQVEQVKTNSKKKKPVVVDTTPTKPVVTIQDRIAEKSSECVGEMEGQIDDMILSEFKDFPSPYGLMHTMAIKGAHTRYIVEWAKKRRNEFDEVLNNTTDKDLKEGYSNFTKPNLKKIISFCDQVILDCQKVTSDGAVTRKPRKRKEKSPDQLVSKVKVCVEFKELNLKSVDTKQIIGATQLWVYNTKTRKLGVYHAEDAGGFQVKGTSLTNFSETKSIQKKLRKPEVSLPEVLQAGKVTLRNYLDGIRAVEGVLNGRLNADTILLRVMK